MTNFLLRKFIKDSDSRESYGKLAGWVGIISNLMLFVVKLIIGMVTSSISITTDAINNLSDSSASIITILGFKMASKPADDEHPYGHARFEYISGLLVACIIFVIGVQFFINSLKKTFSPEQTNFSWIIAVLLLGSILAKIWQSSFYKTIGAKIDSKVLFASAIDSRNDVITTTVVLISSIAEYLTNLKLDGPVGMIVSVFLIYSGVELLRDTLNPLLGTAPKKKLVKKIQDKIESYPSVIGMHDLMVHNYGPGMLFASAHVEMSVNQDILVSHEIIDTIERDFLKELEIDLVIHLDPVVTDDPELDILFEKFSDVTANFNSQLSIHDFRLVRCRDYTRLIFDVTVSPKSKISDSVLRKKYSDYAKELNENYETVVTIDRNYISFVE